MLRTVHNQSGVTLVELLISVGLFGISAFTMATLLAENSIQTVRAQNEARLSESILEFTNSLDTLLANTTRVESCNCGGGACIFDEATSPDCGTSGTCGTTTRACALDPAGCGQPMTPIFSVEVEDSAAPIFPRLANCIASPASGGLVPRGCKRLYGVFYAPPAQIASGVVPPPPLLAVHDITAAGSPRLVAKIEGVYDLRCGQTPTVQGGAVAAQQQFVYRFETKIRRWNQNTNPDPTLLEGWHPADANFASGPRREVSATIAFRNLNVHGVHFGKAQSEMDCVPDGGVPADRPVANCCSGYWVGTPSGAGTASTCLSAAQCVPRGGDPALAAVPATPTLPQLACCSHRILGGKCL